jgi:hypothetical protein
MRSNIAYGLLAKTERCSFIIGSVIAFARVCQGGVYAADFPL